VLDALDPLSRHQLHVDDRLIFGDRLALEMITKTLFSQAIKHNPQTALVLNLVVELVSDTRYQVTYTDNGVGYHPFDIAMQADNELLTKCGYGLSAVRRIVTDRHGELCIGNLDGDRGRHARFSLPGHILLFGDRFVSGL
ncbi:MAG: ATP-binding protein, partial [Pseudomonadota bacterium]